MINKKLGDLIGKVFTKNEVYERLKILKKR